jgi:hypothetical protein
VYLAFDWLARHVPLGFGNPIDDPAVEHSGD